VKSGKTKKASELITARIQGDAMLKGEMGEVWEAKMSWRWLLPYWKSAIEAFKMLEWLFTALETTFLLKER